MPKRSKKSSGAASDAAVIFAKETEEAQSSQKVLSAEKDPAAVSLGRRGGLKGGVARASALSAKERKRIASEAAKARWSRNRFYAASEADVLQELNFAVNTISSTDHGIERKSYSWGCGCTGRLPQPNANVEIQPCAEHADRFNKIGWTAGGKIKDN